jgi:nitroreductase
LSQLGNFQPWAFIAIQNPQTKEWIQKVAEESKNLSRLWASPADPRHAPPHTGGKMGHIIGASLAAMNMWLAAQRLA